MSPSSPRSLCLVRLSALGDVVMVLPLVRHLQRSYPGAKITWICGRAVYPVLQGLEAEGIELVPIDKPRGVRDYWDLRRRFAHRTFDVLLCLQASWRSNWIYPCLKAKRKIGYGADRAKDLHGWFVGETLPPAKPHLVEGFLQFAETLGLPWPREIEWGLAVDSQAAAEVAKRLPSREFIALNACSSKPERDWMPERYAEIIDHVNRHCGLDTILIGGPSAREKEMAAQVRALAPAAHDWVGTTRLPQMVALLARCRALLAPDTGAVHIANALGRPVIGLYAVAPADRTGPFGQEERCVDVFTEALRKLLGRERAECPWAQRVHHPEAMRMISVDAVREKIAFLQS